MMSAVFDAFPSPKINRSEIYRYLRSRPTPVLEQTIDSVINEAQNELSYNASYMITDISVEKDRVLFGNIEVSSSDLAKCLNGYESAVIFGATIGSGIDRLIGKYSRIQPSRALVFQAYGAERIESLCDSVCEHLKSITGKTVGPRFSAGYGDLSLEFQKTVFSLLACEKIGLTLNQSLSMSPSKSVTAIAGLK